MNAQDVFLSENTHMLELCQTWAMLTSYASSAHWPVILTLANRLTLVNCCQLSWFSGLQVIVSLNPCVWDTGLHTIPPPVKVRSGQTDTACVKSGGSRQSTGVTVSANLQLLQACCAASCPPIHPSIHPSRPCLSPCVALLFICCLYAVCTQFCVGFVEQVWTKSSFVTQDLTVTKLCRNSAQFAPC